MHSGLRPAVIEFCFFDFFVQTPSTGVKLHGNRRKNYLKWVFVSENGAQSHLLFGLGIVIFHFY